MFSWLVQSDSTAQQLLFSFYEGHQTQSNTWEKTLQDYKTKDKSWRRARPEEVETQQMQRGSEVSGPEEVIRVQTFSCDSVLQTRLDGFFVMWLTWPLHCPICLPGEAVGLLFAVRFGSLLIRVLHSKSVLQHLAESEQRRSSVPLYQHVIDKHRWPVTFGSHAWPYHNIPAPCLTDKAVIRSWIQWICFFLATLAALMDVCVCVFECNQMFVVNAPYFHSGSVFLHHLPPQQWFRCSEVVFC